MMCAGIRQFFLAAVSIEDPDRGHSIIASADDVVTPVPDHDRPLGVNICNLESVAQEFGFVGTRAIELGTEHALKITPELEVIDDALRVNDGFAGRNEHATARGGERGQGIFDAAIGLVLEHPGFREPLPIEQYGFSSQIVVPEQYSHAD